MKHQRTDDFGGASMIKVTDLVKTYDKRNTPALDGVSFNLGDTGLVFIIGKSGSGKSAGLPPRDALAHRHAMVGRATHPRHRADPPPMPSLLRIGL